MISKPHRTSISRPTLILAICGAAVLTTACEPSSREQGNSVATPATLVEPTSTGANTEVTPSTSKQPLDLSRGGNLEYLDRANNLADSEPNNLLPDLFDDKSAKTGARASGRVLMNDMEKASLKTIEGVELKLEVPIN